MRWILILPIFFSSMAFAQAYPFVEHNLLFDGKKIVENGLFTKPATRFEQLLADQSQFKNYDEFLDYLFARNPYFSENYILVHRSESQQPSSMEFPRTIVFEGGVAYAFSDHPSQKEKRVEILQVEPGSYKVSLSEIIFTEQGPKFSKNPASCATCHGMPAKPLWNPYDFWPNTFGSAAGFFPSVQEKAAFAKLSFSSQPALRHLKPPASPDAPTEKVTAFTQYIHQINIGRWIKENLTPEKFSAEAGLPLVKALSQCAKSSERLAPQYASILEDVKKSRQHFKRFLDSTVLEIFPQTDSLFKIDHSRLENEVFQVAEMQLALSNAGIDAHNLTTSLFFNDYLITSPANAPIDFLATLYEVRPDIFAGIDFEPTDISTGRFGWIQVNCDTIPKQSEVENGAPTAPPTWTSFVTVNKQQPVLSRCAKCHVDNIGDPTKLSPKIPFNKPLELARRINDPSDQLGVRIMNRVNRTGEGQMPPGQPLSPEEISALGEFIAVLGKVNAVSESRRPQF